MFDFYQSIHDEHGEQDEEQVEEYIDELMEQFGESPEAQPVLVAYGNIGWAGSMLEYFFNYIGSSPAKMTTRDFNEVLFELIPRKVSVEAERAGEIVAELRAFWSFVLREYASKNAPGILAILDDNATSRLRKLLSDPGNFGMAKSFCTLGAQSGFDMTSQAGLNEFMAVYNAKILAGQQQAPLPISRTSAFLELPSPERPTGALLEEKRKARKQQRVAKKRNRR